MKKVFLVRKDITKPYGEGNWQIMNVAEFKEFKATDEAKGRRFVRLFLQESESNLIIKECEPDEARKIDTALKRVKREREYAKENNITEIPYSLVRVDGELVSSELLIPDEAQSVEEIVSKRMMIEKMREALKHLTRSEQRIIKACFFAVKHKSLREIAKELELSPTTLFDRKVAILKKLRNFL